MTASFHILPSSRVELPVFLLTDLAATRILSATAVLWIDTFASPWIVEILMEEEDSNIRRASSCLPHHWTALLPVSHFPSSVPVLAFALLHLTFNTL